MSAQDVDFARHRVQHYLNERARMRALDPERVHELNVGSEREAVLYVKDLRLLVALALGEEEAP